MPALQTTKTPNITIAEGLLYLIDNIVIFYYSVLRYILKNEVFSVHVTTDFSGPFDEWMPPPWERGDPREQHIQRQAAICQGRRSFRRLLAAV